jgi:hypothetical protein
VGDEYHCSAKLLLHFLQIKVLPIWLVDDFLNSVLIDLAQVVKVGHAFISIINRFTIRHLLGILLSANIEWRLVSRRLLLVVHAEILSVKVPMWIVLRLFWKNFPCGLLLLLIRCTWGRWQVEIVWARNAQPSCCLVIWWKVCVLLDLQLR